MSVKGLRSRLQRKSGCCSKSRRHGMSKLKEQMAKAFSFLGCQLWAHVMFHSKLANIKTLKCIKYACHIVITDLKGVSLGGLCISSAEVARVRSAGFLSPGSQTCQ